MTTTKQSGRRGRRAGGRRDDSLGLYVHVPFCKAKCAYCDFYSCLVDSAVVTPGEFVDLVVEEIRLAGSGPAPGTEGCRRGTIYLGGGTPSLLEPAWVRRILAVLAETFPVDVDEITIEVNPLTADAAWFRAVAEAGVNRVSIGVQSFDDRELGFLGRLHTGAEAEAVCRAARSGGLEDVSLDLMYGLPDQTLAGWTRTLDRAVRCRPTHISAYELTVSPGTELGRRVEEGQVRLPPEARTADLFRQTGRRLEEAGFSRYEVSNYARPGRRCRHNEHYWRGGAYLGFGPGAHSNGGSLRWWNTKDLERYAALLGNGDLPVAGRERVDEEARRRERILLGLRTVDGISAADLGPEGISVCGECADRGLGFFKDGRFRLTAEGLLIADEIAVRAA